MREKIAFRHVRSCTQQMDSLTSLPDTGFDSSAPDKKASLYMWIGSKGASLGELLLCHA